MKSSERSTHDHYLHRAILAAVWCACVLLAAVSVNPPRNPKPIDELGHVIPVAHTVTGSGACDVTGVGVNWITAYASSTPRYRVTDVVLAGVSWPSCSGSSLTLSITDSSNTVIGSFGPAPTPTPVSGNITLSIPQQPDARLVTGVAVTLAGGTTPVPPECAANQVENIVLGTTGNDSLTTANNNDLIYSLSGVDSISSFNGNDCVNGGPSAGDNDTINTGNGDDVVLAGDGTHNVTIGNGNSFVRLGNGSGNTIVGGNGTITVFVGTGTGNSITLGNSNGNGNTVWTGGRTSSGSPAGAGTTTTSVGSGKATIKGGSGNDTIFLSTGNGQIDGGGGTNVCHVPSTKHKYTITNCTVVVP